MKRFIDNMLKQQIKNASNDSKPSTVTIPDGSITTSKLAKKAVYTDAIADSAVTTIKLGAKAVTASKIADGTITLANLSAEVKAKLNS